MSVLIWLQTVCKGYKQTTKVAVIKQVANPLEKGYLSKYKLAKSLARMQFVHPCSSSKRRVSMTGKWHSQRSYANPWHHEEDKEIDAHMKARPITVKRMTLFLREIPFTSFTYEEKKHKNIHFVHICKK